jgi:hypothetical protein
VADSPYTLRIEREDGDLLVIDGLGLARAFLASDISASPGGYNELAGAGDRARISLEDVRARQPNDAFPQQARSLGGRCRR